MAIRRERGEVLEAPEIPLDLLIEILKSLPVKSLARFKCVSKLWSSLIHSQGHLFASQPRLYISLEIEHDCDIMDEVYPDPAKFELLSFCLKSTSKISTVFDLDLTKQGIGGYNMVVLRGLILYTFCQGQAFIYNPTTGQRLSLPTIKVKMYKRRSNQLDYFFGYDPVLDQYKVVSSAVVWSHNYERICEQHWRVFVLEAGSSWKSIEFDHPHFPRSQGVCINGVIYYLASSSVSGRIVISFNVRFEEFNMIQVPSVVNEYLNSCYFELIEYGGKPTIFDYIHLWDPSGLLNLWVLEDAGKWSKKSLVLQPCQIHLFRKYVEVIGTSQSGEVVLKPRVMSPPYILYYNLHKNDVRRVDIRGISEHPLCLVLMDTGESIMHLKF